MIRRPAPLSATPAASPCPLSQWASPLPSPSCSSACRRRRTPPLHPRFQSWSRGPGQRSPRSSRTIAPAGSVRLGFAAGADLPVVCASRTRHEACEMQFIDLTGGSSAAPTNCRRSVARSQREEELPGSCPASSRTWTVLALARARSWPPRLRPPRDQAARGGGQIQSEGQPEGAGIRRSRRSRGCCLRPTIRAGGTREAGDPAPKARSPRRRAGHASSGCRGASSGLPET